MSIKPEITILIPAYQEAEIIASVIQEVRTTMDQTHRPYEILVIDDGSKDETASRAVSAGARVVSHPYNIGNGAAIKTGIRQAKGKILVTMDGDGQHDPADIPNLLENIERYDMVVGARTSDSESHLHRNFANSLYNLFASYICKRRIQDLTSGFRAIKSSIARQFLPLLPNTFSYPTTITMAILRSGFSLTYIPIRTSRRKGKSKIKLLRDGSRFLLIILKIATLFSPMRVFLPVSAIVFLLGLGYGLFKVVFLDGRYGPTSAMLITMSVVIFMVGLVSEQVAQLRYERSENRE
ncbi:MAG: Undecaprenyl-phosphate 4-deoxy-4-formamido-L-arabinose transferase [Deltaproteobacteria bacterium ADurb.Bin151]|nr:MAG: Undecaprenyl-phosphate 4-deoxy-4-formamido-L-arabinose transferase [Deltaproteobacteria bacterium ADurb.Bin151]